VASRAAATNAAGNQRYRRRATTRNNQSQTIILHSAAAGETRLINTTAEHKIISVFYSAILQQDPPRADLRSLDFFLTHLHRSKTHPGRLCTA